MKNYILKTSTVILLIIVMLACNKSKKFSNRMGGYKWKIVTLTVNGTSETNLPELLFKDCDIYKETCKGTWISEEGGRAQFVWQFRDKGKVLEIANQTDHAHGIIDVKAADQCIAFTGVYEVIKSKRKSLVLKSTSITGHQGKEVNIELERKD
jgi:hypothetical protein